MIFEQADVNGTRLSLFGDIWRYLEQDGRVKYASIYLQKAELVWKLGVQTNSTLNDPLLQCLRKNLTDLV